MKKKENMELKKNHDLKEVNGVIVNDNIKSFVCLKDINKIYPNGVQAVYDFNINIHHHEFIVLVGPSGCGKSTTLRMIAGLEDISSGYLYIGKVLSNYIPSKNRNISMVFQSYALYPQMTVYDNIAFPLKVRKFDKIKFSSIHIVRKEIQEVLADKIDLLAEGIAESKNRKFNYSSASVYVSTKLHVSEATARFLLKYRLTDSRDIESKKDRILTDVSAIVAKEESRLATKGIRLNEEYQYLDKNGNPIHYQAKLTKEEIREKVFHAAEILDLGPYLDRRPKELSGGQMQRVALGKAIVRNAKLFLMDEPLSNLDAKLRVQMRSEIVRLHERIGATTIYVTHDQTEAMTMATRIVVMSKGWVQQIGEPQVIYNNPNNIFVATFIGSPAMNIFDSTYKDGVIFFPNGYHIDMGSTFRKTHDDFYDRKIRQTEAFLNTDAVKKMHGLLILDGIVNLLNSVRRETDMTAETKERIAKNLEELKKICGTIQDEDGKTALDLVSTIDGNYHNLRKILSALRLHLLNISGITSKELAILHKSQVFSKDKKEDRAEVLFYTERKGKEGKAVSGYKNVFHVKDSNVVFTNNLYSVLTELLAVYRKDRIEPHPIRIGVRPEHIHLDREFHDSEKSEKFTITSDVVELLGSELLLHINWNYVDMIARVSSGTIVRPHEPIELCMDAKKVLVFDTSSGDTIADWVRED